MSAGYHPMRFLKLLLPVLAVALTATAQTPGQAAINGSVFRPFSADQIHTVGKKVSKGKAYANENAFRVEVEQDGKTSISILRFDRKVLWVLVPEQKMCVQMPWAPPPDIAVAPEGATTKRESLGTEQVGAYQCDKSRVIITYQGKQYTQLEWAAPELSGFVVKRQDEKGVWTSEYQNVKLGPQDPSLFEIPDGYQKMSLGGGFGSSQ